MNIASYIKNITIGAHYLMNILDIVKKRIIELCKIKNISLIELSIKSKISISTIQSIFYKRSKNPGIKTIKKICDGFDISITDFFNTEEFEKLEQEIK